LDRLVFDPEAVAFEAVPVGEAQQVGALEAVVVEAGRVAGEVVGVDRDLID
jgi:hypothetical protein